MNDHFDRGVLLENGNDLKAARLAYEQAIEVEPNHVEALASLAWLDAQAGDSASVIVWGTNALNLDPDNVLARMALASAELQSAQHDAAADRLAALYADPALSGINRAIVLGMVGDLNDAAGETTRAFKAYEASNAQLKVLFAPHFEARGRETALHHCQRLTRWFEAADPEPWREAPPAQPLAGDPKAHVFLVGFPRSGTTLLENVLAAHPDVVALEEKDTLGQAAGTYLVSNEGLERLSHLSSDQAMKQIEAYWSAVRAFGVEARGRLFIDKMPLATVLLPLISKLFPKARILFAVRDPRDVVFSCFRRRFGMNAAMAQFLTLEGAATYYDAVMRLVETYRALLPLAEHIVRYESMVDDFEGTARGACAFLGLEWDEAMADFAAKARARGISTPSAAQVARGLNREGQGAWRHYEAQMAPVLPLLQPWVERFGYEPT